MSTDAGKIEQASCRFYVDAAFTPANIAAATLDTNFAANVVVPGPVYAQSLFLTVEGRGLIILATEQAIVLAVDAATGEAGLSHLVRVALSNPHSIYPLCTTAGLSALKLQLDTFHGRCI